MKKIFFIAGILFFMCVNVFSQSTEKTGYLQKSRNKKTTGWVLLGGGAALDIAGLLAYPKHYNGWGDKTERRRNLPSVIMITAGTLSMIASIPVFVRAHKLKNKAARLSLNTEEFGLLKNGNVWAVNYPVLKIKLQL